MVRAAIGLGSNQGERRSHLAAGVEGLTRFGSVVGVSSVYETAPVGYSDQGPFLNAVAVLETDLEPSALLEGLNALERERGRERAERWGPRTLDLDLLLYGTEEVNEPGLVVPHPELTKRRFVVAPLVEVWPDVTLPDGRSVARFVPDVADQQLEVVADGIDEYSAADDGEFRPGNAWLVFVVVIVGATAVWWLLDWVLSP